MCKWKSQKSDGTAETETRGGGGGVRDGGEGRDNWYTIIMQTNIITKTDIKGTKGLVCEN